MEFRFDNSSNEVHDSTKVIDPLKHLYTRVLVNSLGLIFDPLPHLMLRKYYQTLPCTSS